MSEYIDYLHEVFELAGPITIKRMFDGHTLYYQGLPVGIVYDETLFLKADVETRAEFEKRNLQRDGFGRFDALEFLLLKLPLFLS